VVTSTSDHGAARTAGDREAFWASFAASYYGRQPAELDHPAASFAIGQQEMFALIVEACARRGSRPRQPEVRFHLGACQVLADLDDYLPVPADESLDGYLARLDRQLNGQPYLLTVQRAQTASRPVWKRAAEFLAGLHDAAGSPPSDATLQAFVGRYPSTAPGIHRERSGVFVSAVRGTKDMLVWQPGDSGLPLGTLRYEHATPSARRLRCQPDRLVYWPALYWHVGQSPDAPSAALHLAVLEEPPRLADLIARSAAGVPASPALDEIPAGSPAEPDDVSFPGQYEAAVQVLLTQFGDEPAVRDRLTADWLRRRTGLGFTSPPPRSHDAAVADSDVVARDSVRPVLLARRDAATSWCAADGRVADVRSAPAVRALIGRINDGRPAAVADLLRLAGPAPDRDLARRVLSLLAGWGAVQVIR
jgi:50S ribosomal protein L16 3-hydroxylase